ncbi:Protein of unknown function [Streptomyces sp. TverLS-915]|uniref:DUF2637 domain-containing protein n=1 Tax=Streptomyces sp. TverLS-915 TaxID=1839763 RepID=UPI00081D3E60|nr:DUF2637 domain-containing protein [Streptomyces sp. TverLS-915]SCD49015.1 Protein of unknown function [Streptomyces sp. TverLS-915]
MSSTAAGPRTGVPPLTRPEMGLAGAGALSAAGVGALGLVSSFDAVSTAAAQWGFTSPWMLPVGIDLAIPVFTVANLLLIRLDMALAWVRFVPWVLTLITCGLNVAAGHGIWAKVAHGTMPLLWVVFSEIGAHVYSVRTGAATGRRMEKIRRSRWLLAPLSTFSLWRRMTLWEITSYGDALARERERVLARARLRELHGRRWRSRTPRTERVLLRLGEIAPADEVAPVAPVAGDAAPPAALPAPSAAPELPPVPPAPAPPAPRKTTRKKTASKSTPRTADEVLTEARKLTHAWADAALTADALRRELHCSAAASRTVRDTLRAERAEQPPVQAPAEDTSVPEADDEAGTEDNAGAETAPVHEDEAGAEEREAVAA